MVVLERIKKENLMFQPRDNILKIIRTNLQQGVNILNVFPDLATPGAWQFPFIVIPELELDKDEDNTPLRGVNNYMIELDGTVYEDFTQLSRNRMRTIKQALLNTFESRKERKDLEGAGMSDVGITLEQTDTVPQLRDSKKFVGADFTIKFRMDVWLDN